MQLPGRRRITIALVALAVAVASPVAAAEPPNPPANIPAGPLPAACASSPNGRECLDAGVYYLNQSRRRMHQPPYRLPADFPALSPAEQTLVLVNLDRALYGIDPVLGLTDALNQMALVGTSNGAEPGTLDNTINGSSSNWGDGYENVPLVYQAWMYDDGVGSANVYCSAHEQSGCWGHRRDAFFALGPGSTYAMGAAAGPNRRTHRPGYAMLIVGDDPSDISRPPFQPVYTSTWAQAVAAGAGTTSYDPGVPSARVRVRVSGPGVVRDSSGRTCRRSCVLREPIVKAVRFTARPKRGATLLRWSGGACLGRGTCRVEGQTLNRATVHAVFGKHATR